MNVSWLSHVSRHTLSSPVASGSIQRPSSLMIRRSHQRQVATTGTLHCTVVMSMRTVASASQSPHCQVISPQPDAHDGASSVSCEQSGATGSCTVGLLLHPPLAGVD